MPLADNRFLWAANLLDLQPRHHVLEIGCGAGIFAEQICQRLTAGKLIAIDKSAAMLKKARQRNASFIENGRLELVEVSFEDANFQTGFFHHVVAFNVNFFIKNGGSQFQLLNRILKKNGKLSVFYQAPFEIDLSAAAPIRQNLEEHGFSEVGTHIQKFSPTSAIAVLAVKV